MVMTLHYDTNYHRHKKINKSNVYQYCEGNITVKYSTIELYTYMYMYRHTHTTILLYMYRHTHTTILLYMYSTIVVHTTTHTCTCIDTYYCICNKLTIRQMMLANLLHKYRYTHLLRPQEHSLE